MKDFQPLWIDVRFFKYFFRLWKIVKNDDFFVMGDDNLNAKKYFPKDNGLSWKANFQMKMLTRGGAKRLRKRRDFCDTRYLK